MHLPQVIETKGIRVLTSKQLAEEYGASVQKIKQNFANNRKRFIEEKHYIYFTGDDLRGFKNQVENFDLVDGRTSHLYLWTEKGALLHAKSLNTDKAWEVYDYLVDFYFRAKKQLPIQESKDPVISDHTMYQEGSREIRKYLCAIDVLLTEGSAWHSKGLHDGIMGSLDVLYLSLGKKLLDLKDMDLKTIQKNC